MYYILYVTCRGWPSLRSVVWQHNVLRVCQGSLLLPMYSMRVQTCLQYACTNMPAVCVYEHTCSMHVRTCLQYACTNMPAVCVYKHACSMRVQTCLQYACTNMPAVRQSDNVSVYHSIFCTVLYVCGDCNHSVQWFDWLLLTAGRWKPCYRCPWLPVMEWGWLSLQWLWHGPSDNDHWTVSCVIRWNECWSS